MSRRPMILARKRRIWGDHDGLCGICGKPVPLTGPGVVYDHLIGVWLTGRDEDEDVRPLHKACDKPKTAADQGIIAKVKRIIRKASGWKNPNRRRIVGRGFDKSLRKRMDGTVQRFANDRAEGEGE